MAKQYDRSEEDLGNIIALEHVNLQIENQTLRSPGNSKGADWAAENAENA